MVQSRAPRLNILSGSLVAALAFLPMVVAFAANPGPGGPIATADQPSDKGRAAILRGRVTDDAGAPLAGVRVRAAIPATDMRFVDFHRDLVDGPDVAHKLIETRTDASGAYRLEIPGITGPTKVSLDAMTPGYRRLVGTLMSGGDPNEFEVKPGVETEAPVKLRPSLYFRGTVVDEQGKPISRASVSANLADGGIERTVTNPDGSFELFCYPEKRPGNVPGLGRGIVFFSHPDYIDSQIEDVYTLAPKDRKSLRVALSTGYKVTGTVLGRTGKP
ncbi:MAG: carboxypeptidase-like regulatory domain-containing protein, partial [Isosphaeraceae bacterium]